MYLFLITLLMYILVSGYVLIFSGSVFVEGLVKGWWHLDALEADSYALWWSGLTAFPCLLGILGGIAVMLTEPRRFFKVKALLFVPSVVWTAELVLLNFRWGLQYWVQWLYLGPALLASVFITYCVLHEVRIPITPAGKRAAVAPVEAAIPQTGEEPVNHASS